MVKINKCGVQLRTPYNYPWKGMKIGFCIGLWWENTVMFHMIPWSLLRLCPYSLLPSLNDHMVLLSFSFFEDSIVSVIDNHFHRKTFLNLKLFDNSLKKALRYISRTEGEHVDVITSDWEPGFILCHPHLLHHSAICFFNHVQQRRQK
jgi:hypothetical protein